VVRTLRAQHRRAIAVAGALAIVAIIAVNHTLICESVVAASDASPLWLATALIAAILTVPASALCIVGASGRPLSLGRTSAVELAGTFLNRIAPAGLGRAFISVRYLTHNGLSAERAVSAVAIGSVVCGIAHAIAVVVAWALVARSGAELPHLINHTAVIAVSFVLLLAAAAAALWLLIRPQMVANLKMRVIVLLKDLRLLTADTKASTQLVVGALGVHFFYLMCFMVSLRAAGIDLDPAVAALAYFAGTALADAAPTPGGLGAAEVALASAVIAVGAPADVSVAGVLIYRLATYWMLSIAGYVSWISLRRKGILGQSWTTGRPTVSQASMPPVKLTALQPALLSASATMALRPPTWQTQTMV